MIYFKNDLSVVEKKRIAEIMKQSKCPNESLKNTFKRFAFMQGNNIVYFDDVTIQNRHTAYMAEIEY